MSRSPYDCSGRDRHDPDRARIKRLEERVHELEDTVFMMVRSNKEWSDKFCGACRRPATSWRYETFGTGMTMMTTSIPFCEKHAKEYDEKRGN